MTERIAISPAVHFGKPCVAGTRIPVVDVLELISEGLSFEQITKDHYADLGREDIRACMRYAIEFLDAEELHVAASS